MSDAKTSGALKFRSLFEGLLELRGSLSTVQQVVLGILGVLATVLVWWSMVNFGLVTSRVLPYPQDVLRSIPELHFEDALVRNLTYSLKLNIMGYGFAILVGMPLGFLLGLSPICRGLSMAPINAIRYLPLAAATGLFIMWFGTDDTMKIAFLAFSIGVYLVPTVIQRIDEVDQVYLHTLQTIGGRGWQTIRHVYIPDVIARVWADVIVLVAISWTYIILAELVNRSAGGVGSLIYVVRRQSRPDKMFALLIVIMMVGLLQDRIFRWVGRLLFPHRFNRGGEA